MPSNTGSCRGNSNIDASCQYVAPVSCTSARPSHRDYFFDLDENINSTISIDLLQQPTSYGLDLRDGWMDEFERLRAVHARAPAPPPPNRDRAFPLDDTEASSDASKDRLGRSDEGKPPGSPKGGAPACVRDATSRPTPTLTGPSCSTDSRGQSSPDPMLYTAVLHDWNATPPHNADWQASVADRVEAVREELREMERTLQADTKRRMTQIKQSHPDGESTAE